MAAVQLKILPLLIVVILLSPLTTSKSPKSSSANEKNYESLNDHELSSGSQLPQTRGCSIQDPGYQEDQPSLESAATRRYSTHDHNQDHATDQTESILHTMGHAAQSSEDSSSTKSCSSSNSEDCEAEDHPILMTERFSSSTVTESACDYEPLANDQPQEVISEPPSLYVLIQEPFNVLEKISNVESSKFMNWILNDKSGLKLERIIADHPLCQLCQVKEIFKDWLRGRGITPITWSTLIDALRHGELHTLADDICSHVSKDALFLLARPDAHWDPETYSAEAAQTLRNQYIDHKTKFAYTDHSFSMPFLDVSLRNMTSGVPLLNSIFIQNLDKYSRLSITGQAGAGKTMLLWYIAKEWANHRVLKSTCNVLFLVQLERLPKSKSYTSLEELFEGLGYQELNIKQLAGEIDTRRGSKACFLIDDFASSYSASDANFINDLIYGLLPQSHVIFTSKSYVTKKSDSIEYVEVLGYKDEDLEKHLNTLCKDEEVRNSMLTLWEEQPTVRKMCLLPLHLAMVIDLVKYDTKSTKDSETKLHSNELKIQTRTDIYLSSMNQKLEHFGYFSVKQCIIKKQSDRDPLCKNLSKLLKAGFDMVFTGRNTFDYDPNVQSTFTNIGLVTITKLDTKIAGKTQVQYIFSHPTYREFLAAIYMATLPLDKQLAYITMYGKDVTFSNIWLFYFGLPYEYGNESNTPVLLKRYSAHYSHRLPAAGICDFEFESRFLAVVREIYRADRNPQHEGFITLLKEAGIVVNSSLCLQHSSSYEIKDEKFFERLFLQVSKFQFSLDLNKNTEVISFMLKDQSHSYHLEREYHQLITCARYKEECEGIQGITGIQGNPRSIIDIIGATAYIHRPTPAGVQREIPSVFSHELKRAGFHRLSTLILESNNDEIGIDALQYVQHSNISYRLKIVQMSLSCRHFLGLYDELFSQVKNLYLELRNCGKYALSGLPTDALKNLHGITLISPHDEIKLTGRNNLQFLYLIEVNIHAANVYQWIKYFNGNRHLKTLEISISDISESVAKKVFNNLPQHLENLILEENVFSDRMLGSLSKALTRLSDLRSLSLSNNLIKGSSLQTLAKALSSRQHFQSLDLSYSSSMRICDEGIEALAQVTSLETLNIKGCRIPVRMKKSLVKVIKSLPKLKSLHFRIARVPQPLDLLHLDVIKSLDEMLQSHSLMDRQSLSQLTDHLEDPLRSHDALKMMLPVSRFSSPNDSVLDMINRQVLPALKIASAAFGMPQPTNIRDSLTNFMGKLLNDSESYTFSDDYISVTIPMGDIKELINDTLDLLSNISVGDVIMANVHSMHHFKFTRVRDNPGPASVTLLNKMPYLLMYMMKVSNVTNKIFSTLKIHSHQKLIDRLHKFMSTLESASPNVGEMTQADHYGPNENEIYDQILSYWYEAFKVFDVNDDFNNNFWTSKDILDLFKEMRSMTKLQNLQVEFM